MVPTFARVHAIAIAIMVDLASRAQAGPVPSGELRERARLSTSYFDKIAADLRRHGLMRGTRRGGGGNELGRGAMLISMRDIVAAMDVPLAGVARPRPCRTGDARATSRMSIDLWDAVERRQLEWLGSVTLESMVQDYLRRDNCSRSPASRRTVSTLSTHAASRREPMLIGAHQDEAGRVVERLQAPGATW